MNDMMVGSGAEYVGQLDGVLNLHCWSVCHESKVGTE